MTVRAFILGLLGAVFICSITFYNDMVVRGVYLIGNYLPASVFGSLILFILLINPLLAKIRRNAALTGAELGVIVAILLFACCIPGRSLMHHFTSFLMMPHHTVRINPAWQGDPVRFSESSVADWPKLAAALIAAGKAPGSSPLKTVWARLPAQDQAALAAIPGDGMPPQDQRERLMAALNAALEDPSLAALAQASGVRLPNHVHRALENASSPQAPPEARARANRGILDVCLGDAVSPRKPAVIEHAPPRMLADPSQDSTVALDGFVNGLATGDAWLSPAKVPWGAWTRTLLFWVPLILTTAAMVVGLALVIHRQWASHEHLPYPTIEFARALLPEEGETLSAVLRDRLFWLGATPVFLLYMNNYALAWWPDFLIPIPTHFDFWPVVEYFPVFKQANAPVYCLFQPTVYFCVIGIAYFLASDAAFSLGIAPYLYSLATGLAAGYGIAVGGQFLQPYVGSFFYAGGYCAMFLVLLYTGRHYYRNVLQRSLGLKSTETTEPSAIWGGRVFIVGAVLLVAQLALVGLDIPLGILYVGGAIVIYVVTSRLLAEVGVFNLQPFFFPCVLIWGLLGAKAVGPDQLLIMSMVSSVILIYPREAIMPFVVSGLRLADRVQARVGAVASAGYGAIALGLGVAIPATLYLQYQYGAVRAGDGWATGTVPNLAFNASCGVRNQLAAQGCLDQVLNAGAWARVDSIQPIMPCLIGFAITFSLTWLFTLLRHRFAWWPLHPLIFLVLASWQCTYVAFSFLLGWLVKASVTKYGGAGMYQRLRPLAIGVIAGELLAGGLPMMIGAAYYLATGKPPPPFNIW